MNILRTHGPVAVANLRSPLTATEEDRIHSQSLISAQRISCKSLLTTRQRVEDSHDGLQNYHLAVMLRIQPVRSGWVELVNLRSQSGKDLRVREDAVEEIGQRDSSRVGPCDDRQDSVIYEVICRWR